MPPVFRFAPSPNGYLHLGHAYSALLNVELARASGGGFLLRIEDIDATRCRPEFEQAIDEDLAWLGIAWEQPVRRQSEHLAEYSAALDRLSVMGLVYPSFESRAEIAKSVARREAEMGSWPRDPDGAPLYPGSAGSQTDAERELLLREVNHRVGNSLQIIASLLHLQANSATQEDVKAALTNAMGRVAAVAQVHRRLYTSQDLKSVLLNQYLDALLDDLRRSAEGNRMSRLTLKAEPIEIDPDRAVAIGIVANELVMNAVKYAYPDGAGPIHVDLRGDGNDIVLSISDDGVGTNGKSDPRSTGMGQRIVSAMATKLEATAERDPNHKGTRIVLRFAHSKAAKPAVAAAK